MVWTWHTHYQLPDTSRPADWRLPGHALRSQSPLSSSSSHPPKAKAFFASPRLLCGSHSFSEFISHGTQVVATTLGPQRVLTFQETDAGFLIRFWRVRHSKALVALAESWGQASWAVSSSGPRAPCFFGCLSLFCSLLTALSCVPRDLAWGLVH